MRPFDRFRLAAEDRHGVGDLPLARRCGVARSTYFRRTRQEGWGTGPGTIRISPTSPASLQRDLLVACLGTQRLAAAAGLTALWLHGVRDRPPHRPTYLVAHGDVAPPRGEVHGRSARWLRETDRTSVGHVPTLVPTTAIVSLAHLDADVARRALIDTTHHGLTSPAHVAARLATIGPLPGRGVLLATCEELGGREVESPFHDVVLHHLEADGYEPLAHTLRLDTPDGRGLTIDVPLPRWQVAIEVEGDRFHRTRQQRRSDRRRLAAYAGTTWVPVPVDWRDWHGDREHVLRSIDRAIERQRRAGIGTAHPGPRGRASR